MEQVRTVSSFVDGDTKSVVVMTVWFFLFLRLGPWERGLDTREETLALDVFTATVAALYPASIAQIDLVQNDVFEVTVGLVAKREDEFEVVPADGH